MAKIKKIAVPVPQTRHDFDALAVELGENMRAIEAIKLRTADEMARVKLSGAVAIEALEARKKSLWGAVAAYAEAHRDELLSSGRKSVTIPAGIIGWRISNPAIDLTGDETEIILRLEAMGCQRFLRETIEIDKAALLAEPEAARTIDGIAIRQEEALYFKPLDVEREITLKVAARPAASTETEAA
jgi:phage host-nuclease inhibitor protein Gam